MMDGTYMLIILSSLARGVLSQETYGVQKKHLRRHQSTDTVKQHGRRQQQSLNRILPDQQSTSNTMNGWQGTYYTPLYNQSSDIDFFLLSGQSNMQGQTTSALSIGGDDTYWLRIKSILEAGTNDTVMESDLYEAIYAANSQKVWLNESEPDVVATTLANETMKLYAAGLLDNLDRPLRLGTCSYIEPQDDNVTNVTDVSGGTKPTFWNASCGASFGHELMLSRTLELKLGQQNHFEAVKNAHGGTEIYQHWYPDHGTYWQSLRSSIRSRKGYGNWKGFIWHQGTQEQWTEEEDTSLTYLGNLTNLIISVRQEMFDASQAGTWQCQEEIPVIIVQIGHWPQEERAQRVRDAQAQFCEGDPRAELVLMDDLSRNYHFDAASFLVGGNRIAQAYQVAVHASFLCPLIPAPSHIHTQGQVSAQSMSNSPSLSSLNPQWYRDWDSVICRQGSPPYFWSKTFKSAEACCGNSFSSFSSSSSNYAALCLAASIMGITKVDD